MSPGPPALVGAGRSPAASFQGPETIGVGKLFILHQQPFPHVSLPPAPPSTHPLSIQFSLLLLSIHWLLCGHLPRLIPSMWASPKARYPLPAALSTQTSHRSQAKPSPGLSGDFRTLKSTALASARGHFHLNALVAPSIQMNQINPTSFPIVFPVSGRDVCHYSLSPHWRIVFDSRLTRSFLRSQFPNPSWLLPYSYTPSLSLSLLPRHPGTLLMNWKETGMGPPS